MSVLPAGTVTFLFTDIKGSTRLLRDLGGDRYAQVLSKQRELLCADFEEYGGQVVETQGDAFFVAFSRAKDALLAAIAAQRAIQSHPWPKGKLVPVRMGLHTGEPLKIAAGYVGMDVHRAARICAASHGRQILLSQTTRDLVADDLPEGVSLRDLSEHRLKDLVRPERLFQVVAPDLPFEFPPLKSADALRNNLPIQLTSFFGQERELSEVKRLLNTTRLVTLTGVGRSGKTRLALQVAAQLLEEYPDGVWWVELAPVADPAMVPEAVASVLNVRQQPGRTVAETLVDHLRLKAVLLVFADCEHLPGACARLADALLGNCSNLRIVVTSREGLGVAGEALYEAGALDSWAGGAFEGRQREMGELEAALEAALSGRGRLVMLVGEPGIGKTRTALELATYAGLRGAQVLWGRCYEAQGAPPYWPWVQAIRSCVRERAPEQLRAEMSSGAADIAEIVPEVRERIPDLKPPPALGPEQARFRLFDSVTAFFKRAADTQPLVLILDNLHWADKPSLLLLEFLARELEEARLLVIGTYRDVNVSRQHPLFETLGELTRERLFERVRLRGLTQQDVGRSIELVAGISPPQSLINAVHTHTDGNPFFMTEVVRLLMQEGELDPKQLGKRQDWTVRIPEGVREVIGRRLNYLSQQCNQTLSLASVIGRQFQLDQLQRLLDDLSGERLLEVIEEALAARLVEELPGSPGRYQFTHGLIQETLVEELSTVRRVQLHARIAKALEALYGADTETHAAQLAHHFAEAMTVTGTEKVVRYSRLAGERALRSYAYEEALANFQKALAAREGQLMDAETATLLFDLGRAQAAMGQREEALSSFGRAFDYNVATGDVPGAVAVAECPVPHLPGQLTGAHELLKRALALVPTDSPEAGRLLSLYGTALGVDEGDYLGAEKAFDQALAIAQREQDSILEMQTLARAGRVNGYHLRLQESLEQSLRAIALAQRLDDPMSEASSRYFAALALWSMGDVARAQSHATAGLAPAERLRDRLSLANILWANETICRLTGDFRSARSFSNRGLALMPRDPRLLGTRTLLEYEMGDYDQGDAYYRRMLDTMRQTTSGASFEYAFVASVTGFAAHYTGLVDRFDFPIAKTAGKSVLSSPSTTPLVAIRAQTGLALLAVRERDVTAALEGYAFHGARRGTMTPGGMGSVDHLLGLLAVTLGRLDVAMDHFDDALVFCRRAGYRPEYAHAAYDFAVALRKRNGLGDHQKAAALQDEAFAISRELGMRALRERT